LGRGIVRVRRALLHTIGGVTVAAASAYLFAIVYGLGWYGAASVLEKPIPTGRHVTLGEGLPVLLVRFPASVINFSWWFFVPVGALLGTYLSHRLPLSTRKQLQRLALRAGMAVGLAAAIYMVIRGSIVPSLQPGVTGGSPMRVVGFWLATFALDAALFVPFCILCIWAYLRSVSRGLANG
jgi:hypothetical protein